jgi:bifunctional UDP-N-acetylglucosamine pyrophosphorylase/glucosamine-1-phosphate N-acetyltransferase
MKAIILAAGEWTRLKPITNTVPKPLIKIFWKTILEYNLESIYKHVAEIIIIVKYKQDLIKKAVWNTYKWVKVTYKEQSSEKGTWAAIKWIESDMDVIIMNWDSIFDYKDIEKLVNFNWYWVLVQKVSNPEKYWIYKIDNDDNILNIVEKPNSKEIEQIWNLSNLWIYKFDSKIFEIVKNIKISKRWEYEITDAINEFVKQFPFKAFEIEWEFIDIWYPWDILTANAQFLDNLSKSNIKWTVEEWVTIKWNIILEEWAILKSGTYIEWNCYIGKDSNIWPNTYLRNGTTIWESCRIWNAVEIKNTSIWDNTNIAHLSYVWDSILWSNINLGWWFLTANLRHDKANIRVPIKWELVDTWLQKLWIIIWDNCKTWINTSSMPWRILENDCYTNPGDVIK